MTENSLITLYCIVDDFIHRFLETSAGKKNLVRGFDRTADLKTFHKNAENHYKPYFPALTNYENFIKASNSSAGFIAAFVQYQLFLNRMRCPDSVFYVDSTPVSVCENRYISSHKVAKGVASRGKSTKGWFYGFKLHGVCTDGGTLVRLCFRPRQGA